MEPTHDDVFTAFGSKNTRQVNQAQQAMRCLKRVQSLKVAPSCRVPPRMDPREAHFAWKSAPNHQHVMRGRQLGVGVNCAQQHGEAVRGCGLHDLCAQHKKS